jgi:hypothetical protein
MRFCFLTFLFLKPIAKRMQTIFRHGFLFWKHKTVSKTGYQTGSRLCLPANEKLTRKAGARKSNTSKTPDLFCFLCSEMKRLRRDMSVFTLKT